MKIAVVGLGLIGGSIAKALKKHTSHAVYGIDIDPETVHCAIAQEVIDGAIEPSGLSECDIVFIALWYDPTVEFILQNADNFKKGGLVCDTCGIKYAVVSKCEKPLLDKGVSFIGCHPMAGREYSGFAYSTDDLFEKASFIITPTENTDRDWLERLEKLSLEMGFHRYVTSSPKDHDRVIAFTSQLAHIVSSAYIKSPSAEDELGFSAGSFKDLTRVAKLNEDMWTPLFLNNSDALVFEIDQIIYHLQECRNAISENDPKTLHELLRHGRELKELSNSKNR